MLKTLKGDPVVNGLDLDYHYQVHDPFSRLGNWEKKKRLMLALARTIFRMIKTMDSALVFRENSERRLSFNPNFAEVAAPSSGHIMPCIQSNDTYYLKKKKGGGCCCEPTGLTVAQSC